MFYGKSLSGLNLYPEQGYICKESIWKRYFHVSVKKVYVTLSVSKIEFSVRVSVVPRGPYSSVPVAPTDNYSAVYDRTEQEVLMCCLSIVSYVYGTRLFIRDKT